MARTTTKNHAATAATSAAVQAPDDGFTPIELTTSVPADMTDREPFFSVDGRMFTIPRQAPPNLAMVYLRVLRTAGADKAVQVIMDKLLGPEALDALADCPSVTEDQMKAIVARVQIKIEGVMEKVTGN